MQSLPVLPNHHLFPLPALPVVPEEVKPKFVKGTKRYGRRSLPDRPDSELTADSEGSRPFRTEQKEPSPAGVRRIKLRRSTSLESVEVRDVVLLHPSHPLSAVFILWLCTNLRVADEDG